ncbi:MAG: sigma-70 family RNA polymerase sigma factor [Candidatus Competibacteraceae bacterium]|nr:sigma-70 family RNA polymerase sigma factor [Candidatus Competibacteraceae bacterium]MCB1811645.1 sigma-70 family RNA polymerase sigma factor [Candidatus Competibacteraceae bacterium]
MPPPPELLQKLLRACAQSDHDAFAQLYQQAAPKLFALCRYMLRDDNLAEEALQETFVQIWRDAADYNPHRALAMTWMSVIARHRCLDLLRRRQATLSLDDDLSQLELVDQAAGPLELTAHWSDRQALGRCLKTLTEQQRLSITMAFYRGFSHQQLSAYLAIPIGTVKSWIRRGLNQLQRCLQQ